MKVLILALIGLAFARTLPDCPKGISKKKPSSSYCRCPAGSFIRAERQKVRSGRYKTASEKVGFYCKTSKTRKHKRPACPMTATKAKPSTTMCSCPKKVTNGKRYVLHAVKTKSSKTQQQRPQRGGRGQRGQRGQQGGSRGGYSRGGYGRGGNMQKRQQSNGSGRGRGLQQDGYPQRQQRGQSRGQSRGGYGGRGQRGQSRGNRGQRGQRGQGRGGMRKHRGGRKHRAGYGYYCAELKQCTAQATSTKTAVKDACFCAKGQRLRRVFSTSACPQKKNKKQGGRGGRRGGRGGMSRGGQSGRGQGQSGRGGYNPYGRGGSSQGRGSQGGRGGYNPYQRRGGNSQQGGNGGNRRLQSQQGYGRGQQQGGQQGGQRGGYNPYSRQRGGSSRGGRGQRGQGRGQRGQGQGRGSSRGGRGGRRGGRGGRRGGRKHNRKCRKSSYYCQTIKACPTTATSAAKGTPNYCKCAKGRLMRHITRSRSSSSRSRRSQKKAVYYCSQAKACPAGVSSQFSCICTTGKKAYKRLAGTSSSRARFGVFCRTKKSSGTKKHHQKKSWCSRLHYDDECGRSRGCQWDAKTRKCSAGFSGDQKKYHTTTGGGN